MWLLVAFVNLFMTALVTVCKIRRKLNVLSLNRLKISLNIAETTVVQNKKNVKPISGPNRK
jgi:hypothetical protein